MGVTIAIYQDDFDLPCASVTTAQIHWMDQAAHINHNVNMLAKIESLRHELNS